MLVFEQISLSLKEKVDKYYFKYGEGSCQHSFTTSFCFNSKYDDRFCEKDSYLYILRNGLRNDTYRTYLFPMGEKGDKDLVKSAIETVVEDAHSHNKKVMFNSITESSKNIIEELFKDRFVIEEKRDLYEYIYSAEDLGYLKGSKYYTKRNEVSSFIRKYEDKLDIRKIESCDVENIKKLSSVWMQQDITRCNDIQLITENKALNIAFENYDKLGIIGLVVYIDKDLAGFIIGVKLNDESIDAMIEKGNVKYKGIYKVLNKEFSRICCDGYKFVNLEEDLGVEGLRNMKLLYHPVDFIKKYVATEV